ncbi:MAG TPA: EndoU domain-containing protein [Myxococcaceae bacterium]|nr:EndoU domain-containing protein [Myxococcaceae bacterium]
MTIALWFVAGVAVAQPQIGPSELARAKAMLDLHKAQLSAEQYALLSSQLAQTQQAYVELTALTEATAVATESAAGAEVAAAGGRTVLGGIVEVLPLLLFVYPATAEAPGMKQEKPQVQAAQAKLEVSVKELNEAVRKVEKERQDANVDLTTPNVRDHILDGDGPGKGGGHRPGAGKPGKSEFPAGWTDAKIIHEISDVATDPGSSRTPGPGGRTIVEGTRDGVSIRVIIDADGKIITGFPVNRPRNP